MEKIRNVIQKKIIIFLIQFIILSIFIFSLGYKFKISFDSGILPERELIIQFLANYIMFDGAIQFFFLFLMWIIPIMIPILLFKSYKKATIMNMTSFFFPNFFFFVFLARYSINYYNSNILFLLFNTIILGIIIVLISLGGTFIIKEFIKTDETLLDIDLDPNNSNFQYVCVKCGTEFRSKPKYCYNCLNKIIEEKQIKEQYYEQ